MANEFSVTQFFRDDAGYETVVQFVDVKTAIERAVKLCTSVGGRIGTTVRVIITDGGDCICWEWEFGKGVTFPPKENKE